MKVRKRKLIVPREFAWQRHIREMRDGFRDLLTVCETMQKIQRTEQRADQRSVIWKPRPYITRADL